MPIFAAVDTILPITATVTNCQSHKDTVDIPHHFKITLRQGTVDNIATYCQPSTTHGEYCKSRLISTPAPGILLSTFKEASGTSCISILARRKTNPFAYGATPYHHHIDCDLVTRPSTSQLGPQPSAYAWTLTSNFDLLNIGPPTIMTLDNTNLYTYNAGKDSQSTLQVPILCPWASTGLGGL